MVEVLPVIDGVGTWFAFYSPPAIRLQDQGPCGCDNPQQLLRLRGGGPQRIAIADDDVRQVRGVRQPVTVMPRRHTAQTVHSLGGDGCAGAVANVVIEREAVDEVRSTSGQLRLDLPVRRAHVNDESAAGIRLGDQADWLVLACGNCPHDGPNAQRQEREGPAWGLDRIFAHRSCVRQNADARKPHSGECSHKMAARFAGKVRRNPIEALAWHLHRQSP